MLLKSSTSPLVRLKSVIWSRAPGRAVLDRDEHEPVGASTAREHVLAGAAGDGVVVTAAVQHVVAALAEQDVAAIAAEHGVVILPAF